MSWDRQAVAAALVDILGPATGVKVHPLPPEIVNPMCLVVSRPTQVLYATAAFGVDDAQLPVVVVGGVETEDQIEALKVEVRQTVEDNPSLDGVVKVAWPTEERNWRNYTGAGGVQLLTVELVLQIQM